jgi:hypothetical protein
MSSGDDIEAGRVTTAESTTDILGAIPSERDVDFNGSVILRVAPQPGDLQPNITLDGIHGVGNNGAVAGPVALPGGNGVVGFGGPNQGTGIVGLGGGGNGSGGIGVHGIGGSQIGPSFSPSDPPGVGVVAQGGRMGDNDNDKRFSHGAGMIAIAGGSKRPIPPLVDTGSIGVYAQGAEAEVRNVNIDNVDTIVGPIMPGAGVLGRGGVPIPRDENPVAAGVIGLAGDTAIPPISETGNKGVYGGGPVGIFGHGFVFGVHGKSEQSRGVVGETDSDVGIYGLANKDTGRGGAFQSERSAQLWLVPQNQPAEFPEPVAVNPTAIQAKREEGPKLPKDGRGGDLMTIADRQGQCTLWFCVKGEGASPASWAQVLLGPSFDGQA